MASREPDFFGERALADAMVTIKRAVLNHAVLVVNTEAEELLYQHPYCGMSFAELQDVVFRLAAHDHVPMQLG
jgi:hypothetical protein